VVGAGGMLGQDVVRAADAVGYTHAQLDVTDRAAVAEAVGPDDVVINCAAWTDVDGAEAHEDQALRINRDGARNLAEAAGRVLYVSSDYVFDGRKRQPYLESDPVNPLSAYGRTKVEGERATAEANPRHHIVRTSWLFGTGGPNFVETMLRLGRERDTLRVVDDQVGRPTYTAHLAGPIAQLARGEDYGIHHRAGSGECSWFEFASEIMRRAELDCQVEPCTTAEFPRAAARPAYTVLGTERRGLEPLLPDWRQGLSDYLAERSVREARSTRLGRVRREHV
jgi:dTDP-4-dehydrorhamnose reductase